MISVCTGAYIFPLAEIVLGSGLLMYLYWCFGACVTLCNSRKIFTSHMPQERRLLLCVKNCWYVPTLFLHAVVTENGKHRDLVRCIIVGFLYCVGSVAYASRYPEKKWPQRFDYFGSHEIMHVCVVLAGTLHLQMFIASSL